MLSAALAGFLACASAIGAEATAPTLTTDDAQLLAALIPRPLVDPSGMTWVSVPMTARSIRATTETVQRHGWLVPTPSPSATSVAVVFADGERIEVAKDVPAADDFLAYGADLAAAPVDAERTIFATMDGDPRGVVGIPPLAVAAWLHRLGRDSLAAGVMARIRAENHANLARNQDVVAALRADLAWYAFSGLINAYLVKADDEALAQGHRLLDLYPDITDPQAALIVADIDRRRRDHHDDQGDAWKVPADWAQWDDQRRLAYLIANLDRDGAGESGEGICVEWHGMVSELVSIGDAAVPALIDDVEKDERLTRCVSCWRVWSRDRHVMPARVVAMTALNAILSDSPYKDASVWYAPGDDHDRQLHDLVDGLRAYWKQYGGAPPERRLMAVLTDVHAKVEDRCHAADRLAAIDNHAGMEKAGIGDYSTAPGHLTHTAILGLHDPTVAEAIIQALDQEQQAPVLNENGYDVPLHDYLRALTALQDGRVATQLAQRAAKPVDLKLRCAWAKATFSLGNDDAMRALAAEFGSGTMASPTPPTAEVIGTLYCTLIGSSGAQAQAAVRAVADPRHPFHRTALDGILASSPSDGSGWFASPACVALLATALDDMTPTGGRWRIQDGHMTYAGPHGSSWGPVTQEFTSDQWADQAAERRCDLAAHAIAQMVIGLPGYHPLLKDRDQRLAEIVATLQAYGHCLRVATSDEQDLLAVANAQGDRWCGFAPEPLLRPATADDQAAGRALFTVGPGARVADLRLPAKALYHAPGKADAPEPVVVVQAEDDAAGHRHLGLLASHHVLVVDGSRVTDVQPFPAHATVSATTASTRP